MLAESADVPFKTSGKSHCEADGECCFLLTENSGDDNVSPVAMTRAFLPEFIEGESGSHEPSLQKQTQPPKPYTEGTLLRAMESAGKTVDDEEPQAMKENGIGRPSTHAAIIETLFRRHYITRERKNIVATRRHRLDLDDKRGIG